MQAKISGIGFEVFFMISCGITNVGRSRQNNQDSIFVSDTPVGPFDNVYVVADGMGGHKAGEVASSKAIEFFIEYIRNTEIHFPDIEEAFFCGIKYANSRVYELSLEDEDRRGMGTTFTVCAVSEGIMYYAHIGDSRLYILSENKLKRITKDHSLVEDMVRSGEIGEKEAAYHPMRNVLTRALGTDFETEADVGSLKFEEGDIALLCSDGLFNMLEDENVAKIINLPQKNKSNLENAGRLLIEKANEAGGYDNISVILICRG